MKNNDNYPRISLKAARVNANLSQRQAAEKLGICIATLQNYEAGITVPDWDTVDKISKLYEFPAEYIFFTRNYA